MEEVLPAHHVGDALRRIVDHDRKVIAGRRVLARQHDVAPQRGIGTNNSSSTVRALTALGPGEIERARRRLFPPPLRGRDREGGIFILFQSLTSLPFAAANAATNDLSRKGGGEGRETFDRRSHVET